jgi:hypothetical protein
MATWFITLLMGADVVAHAPVTPRIDCGGTDVVSCLPNPADVRMWFDAMAGNAAYGQGYHSPHHGQTATWYDQSGQGNNAMAATTENSCHLMAMADDHDLRNGNCKGPNSEGHPVVSCLADVPAAETQVLQVTGPVLTGTDLTIFLVAGSQTPAVSGTNPAPVDPDRGSIVRIGTNRWIGLDDADGTCIYTQSAAAVRTKKCWANPHRPSGTGWSAGSNVANIPEQGDPGHYETAPNAFTNLDLYVFTLPDTGDLTNAELYRPFPVKAFEGSDGVPHIGRESFITDILKMEGQTGEAFGVTVVDTSGAGAAPAWTDSDWLIGSGSTDEDDKGNHWIAEMIVYDEFISDVSTIEVVSDYLMNKWNLNDMDCTCNDHELTSHEGGLDCNFDQGCTNSGNPQCTQTGGQCCFQHTTKNCPPCGTCGNGLVERGESCDSGSSSAQFHIKAACDSQAPGSCGGCSATCQVEHCPGYGGAFWLFECAGGPNTVLAGGETTQYSRLMASLGLAADGSGCPDLPDGHPCEAWPACPATPFDFTSNGCVFIGNGETPPFLTWHIAANERLMKKQRAMSKQGELASKADVKGLGNGAFSNDPAAFSLLWATHGLITGDPHFTSFSGGTYEILGTPDHVYSLISTPELQYNAQFVAGGHNSTWIGAIGLVVNGHTVAWMAHNNTAFLDGKELQASSDKSTHPLGNGTYVAFTQAKHPAPARMILRIPGFTIRLTRKQVSKVAYVPHGAHMKRQGTEKNYHWGARPWYFDQHIMRMAADKGTTAHVHGLIGQTASFTKPVKSQTYHGRNRNRNGEGVIEGKVSDYEVSGLLKTDSKFTQM